jgi:hypothetical protein
VVKWSGVGKMSIENYQLHDTSHTHHSSHLAEHYVTPVQPRARNQSYEELGSIRVWARVCHGLVSERKREEMKLVSKSERK